MNLKEENSELLEKLKFSSQIIEKLEDEVVENR